MHPSANLRPTVSTNPSQPLVVAGALLAAGVALAMLLLSAVESQRLSSANLAALTGGIGSIAVLYRLTRDWLSPAFLISGIWSLTLFLATFDVQFQGRYSDFNTPIFAGTWLILLSSLLSFVVGTFWGVKVQEQRSWLQPSRVDDLRLVRKAVYYSFALALVGYAICYTTAGTAPILVDYLNDVRTEFRVSGYGLLMSFFMVTISFSAYLCGIEGVAKNYRLVCLGFVCFCLMLSTTERADSFQTFVVGAITYLLSRRHFQGRVQSQSFLRTFLPLGLAGAGLTAAFLYVGSVRSAGERGVSASKIVDVENDLLAQLYIYSYVPSIKNLQWGTEQEIGHTYGSLVARPLLWLVGKQEWIPEDIDFGGVNTVTWLWYYYRDFGYLGFVMVPFGLGVVSSVVYRLAVRQPRVQSISLYGLMVSCIIWTTGTERFFETMTFIYGCLLFGIGTLCRKANRLRERRQGGL